VKNTERRRVQREKSMCKKGREDEGKKLKNKKENEK
jgi:hypothetical protein